MMHCISFREVPSSYVSSRDSVVGIVTSYELDDRGIGVRVPVGSRIFSSLSHRDRRRGPHIFLSSGYRGLSRESKPAGA
jgi:hypothetical protein